MTNVDFNSLEKIFSRPRPFEFYSAMELWNDSHTSQQMLAYHLNPDVDISSRNSAFIDRSVRWIVSRFSIGPGSRIADFGCGPGLYTARLARGGAKVTGIDFSKRSTDYARSVASGEGLTITYVNEDYLEFETDDRFDLIMMIMCDFCALSPEQRRTMLGKFRTMLRPEGHVLLDVYSLTAFEKREEITAFERSLMDGFWSPNDYYGFLNTFKYDTEEVVLDKYTIIEPRKTRIIYNWLQYFSQESLEREFKAAGLDVEDLYSNVAGDLFDPEADEFAVVARRK
jgi:SAM-dependent methyltransferase